MGVVYRAEHVITGEPAAVKTVLSAAESMLASIRREIHALSRVRHPGVVRILSQGLESGVPWYAMELLAGRTLRDYIDEYWAPPRPANDVMVSTSRVRMAEAETLEADPLGKTQPAKTTTNRAKGSLPTHLLALLGRLCAPLGFLHGSGFVHRDLKPENVFIREDGTPVLVDLGIASQFGGAKGREELEAGGKVMGSLPYMAPEQIRGELVDARADLYAFGCVLYECLTGRPPFVGGISVLAQHLKDPFLPPSHYAPSVPEELDELALRLLEKLPQDRLGYADDVALALSAFSQEHAPRADLPKAEPYLYRPAFAGRGAALAELLAAIDLTCEAQQGGMILIGGESGAGKTRLVMEAARLAVQHGLTVVTGQCLALGVAGESGPVSFRASPLHSLRPFLFAVADRCRALGVRATRRLLGERGVVLSVYEPGLAELPGQNEVAAPPSLPPEAARARALAALKETLFAFADKTPLLLVLDDLQWADELTLSFLSALSPSDFKGRAVLIVGTYRAEEANSDLEETLRATKARRVVLERLDADCVGKMVCGMLALRDPPAPLVDFLLRSADGNPFFVAEYLRAAIVEGMLTRGRDGQWSLQGSVSGALDASLPLPRALAQLIERRLLALDDGDRTLLELATVLGRELDGDLLMSAVEMDAPDFMDAIEELRRRQILEETESGRIGFVHDKIREIAYERIPEWRRRALHLRAAVAIEARSPLGPDASSSLAHHYATARVHDKAGLYFVRAGDGARAVYANGEAISFYRAAIREIGDALAASAVSEPRWHEALGQAHESLGDMLALAGRQDEARAAYEEALAPAPADDRVRRARLHRKIGKSWEMHHKHANALAAYAAAETALGEGPSESVEVFWYEWMQIQIDRISAHYFMANVEALAALVENVRPVAERYGTPRQRARFFQALIQMNVRSERYMTSAATVDYARACLVAWEEAGNKSEIANASFALAAVLLWHGAIDEADERMTHALDVAEKMGDVPLQSRCLTYLTTIQRRHQRVEETRRFGELNLAMAEAGHMMDYAGAARANLGWSAWRTGDMDGAEKQLQASLECWSTLAMSYPLGWTALLPLIAIRFGQGRIEEAIQHAEVVLDIKQQCLPDEISIPLGRGIDAWKREHVESARDEIERALHAAERLGYL